jgi:protein SCO1/2
MIRRNAIIFSLAFIIIVCPGYAHEAGETDVSGTQPSSLNTIGMVEKTGQFIDLGTKFFNEEGVQISLSDAIKGPTILSFTYFSCKDQCTVLITSISQLLRAFTDRPGSEPNLITVSIDHRETPADARESKRIAYEIIEKPYPKDKWHFLTGTSQSIHTLTDEAGFNFVMRETGIDHPLGLIILSPKGQVSRYILGTDFLPADLSISLMEANTGTIQPTIARLIRLCFSYDPASRRLVFNTLQVSAVVILSLVSSFIIFLLISTRLRRQKGAV